MDGYNILYFVSFCRNNPTLMLLSFIRKSAQWHFNDNQCQKEMAYAPGNKSNQEKKVSEEAKSLSSLGYQGITFYTGNRVKTTGIV